MTAPRYVGRFEVMEDWPSHKIVLTGQPGGFTTRFCTVPDPDSAQWIAAALNAYNQQEQETRT